MIKLIESTFKQYMDSPLEKLLSELRGFPIEGINWWNSNNFSYYLRNLHKNPWDLLYRINENINPKKQVVDVRVNQLSNYKSFSSNIVNNYFEELSNQENLFIKIYDPLNDVRNITKIIDLAVKNNLKIIGGIFLRPDLKDYPDFHSDLIKTYDEYNINYLSLIEPLGILKQNEIQKIKKKIDEINKKTQINISINQNPVNQSLIILEAMNLGITEYDCSVVSSKFGFPSINTLYETALYSQMKIDEKDFPSNLLNIENYELNLAKNQKISTKEENQGKIKFPTIPLNTIKRIVELKYFTNLPFDLSIILNQVIQTQADLGYPPLIEPFLSLIISQSIFRLQNNNKGVQTLDTLKYVAGFWGKQPEQLNGDYKDLIAITDKLKKNSKLFKIQTIDEQPGTITEPLTKKEFKTQREKILFTLFPEESNYFYYEYPLIPKKIDLSKRENIAKLLKVYLANSKSKQSGILINQADYPESGNDNSFRWRYLSRLFQMGKF